MKTPRSQIQTTAPAEHQIRAVAYHELTVVPTRDVYHLHPSVFNEHVGALTQASRESNTPVLFTFDDAHISQVNFAAPILENHGVRGLFFVPASWVGTRPEVASWAILKDIVARGHTIGSHGLTHEYLSGFSEQRLKHELVCSRTILEDQLAQPVRSISMPGGRWNRNVMRACLEAGYQDAFTSAPNLKEITIQGVNDTSLTVHGRLVVRRTMPLQYLPEYVLGNRLRTTILGCEYTAKQLLHKSMGDSTYRLLWRSLLRRHQ